MVMVRPCKNDFQHAEIAGSAPAPGGMNIVMAKKFSPAEAQPATLRNLPISQPTCSETYTSGNAHDEVHVNPDIHPDIQTT
jgi:hypothetical protein